MIELERIQISLPPLIVLQQLRTDILANRSCLEMITEDGRGGWRRRAGNKMELVIPFIIPILNQLGQFKHCDMTMMVILMIIIIPLALLYASGWWSFPSRRKNHRNQIQVNGLQLMSMSVCGSSQAPLQPV